MREYFSHDYGARHDPKLLELQIKYGIEGIGTYWCLIEILYENGGSVPEVYIDRIAFELRTQSDRIASVLNDFELFYCEDGMYRSESIDRRLNERNDKSEKARQSALSGWERRRNPKPNVNIPRNKNVTHREKKEDIPDFIIPDLSFQSVWEEWKAYRKEIKKPIKPVSQQAAYEQLIELSQSDCKKAEKIVKRSIANGWQGLFPPKETERAEPVKSTKLDI